MSKTDNSIYEETTYNSVLLDSNPIEQTGNNEQFDRSLKQFQKAYPIITCKTNKNDNPAKPTKVIQRRQHSYKSTNAVNKHKKMGEIRKATAEELKIANNDEIVNKTFTKLNLLEEEAGLGKHGSIYESETDESDTLQECLDTVQPKRRKRRKQELSKEEQESKARKDLQKRTCEVCFMVFSIPKGLQNHMRVKHTFEKPYSCDICGERFSVQSTYALHRRRHLGIKPHLCSICGKNFLRNTDLQIHMRIHNKVRDVKCSLCANTYNSTMSLKKHMLIKHTDPNEWKHECEMCGKKCVSTTTLNLHLKQHKEDRSFKCHICGKGFYTNQNMKVHVRTHSAATKFNCEHCSSGYRSNEALQRHLLRMHGIGEQKRPSLPKFFCPVCNEGFLQQARLERHIKLHETGEDEYPFKCEPCFRQYKDKNFFAMHMKNKHNVIIDEDYFKSDSSSVLDSVHSYRSLIYKEGSEDEADDLC